MNNKLNTPLIKMILILGFIPSLLIGGKLGFQCSLIFGNMLPGLFHDEALLMYSQLQPYIGIGYILISIAVIIILGKKFISAQLGFRNQIDFSFVLGYLGIAFLIGIASSVCFYGLLTFITTRS